jgi:PKD repeat protein
MRFSNRCVLACLLCLLFLAALAPSAVLANTVFGTMTYEDKRYTSAGFPTPAVYDSRPIRFADVEIVTPLGSFWGQTNDNGVYSILINNQGTVGITIRVYADDLSNRVIVRSNSSAVYTASWTLTTDTNVAFDAGTRSVTVGTGAGAFNIYDVLLLTYESVESITGANDADFPNPAPRVTAYWQSGSTQGTWYNPSNNSIYILGSASDPDEYDDDIVMHEMAHFLADLFSRDDSPGGAHSITGRYDPRLTWSEGWASFYGSAARRWVEAQRTGGRWPGSPVAYFAPQWYVDNLGTGSSAFEIETPSFATQTIGADNECAVAAVLWDMVDTVNEGGFDALNENLSTVWGTFNNFLPTRTNVTLEDFWDGWITTYPGILAQTTTIFNARTILYAADASEGNNTWGTATPFGGVPPTASITRRTFYPAGDEDWFGFGATNGSSYRIETTNLGDGADTWLELYASNGTTVLASNDDRSTGNQSSLINWTCTAGGTYYVKCFAYNQAGAFVTYGYYDLVITQTGFTPQIPPTASVSATPTTGYNPLTVNFSGSATDSDGRVACYEWDFEGNGVYDYFSYDSGNTSFTYFVPGTYAAQLRVTDDDGLTGTQTVQITVNETAGTPTVTVGVGLPGLPPYQSPLTVNLSATVAGGPIVAYEWDFEGDGTYDYSSTTTAAVTHVYRLPGAYLPKLRVTNSSGLSGIGQKSDGSLVVNNGTAPPDVTALTPVPNNGNIPLAVTFTATAVAGGAKGIQWYEWDFDGDGTFDVKTAGNTVNHTYTRPGVFSAKVRATDGTAPNTLDLSDELTTTVSAYEPALWGTMVEPQAGNTILGNIGGQYASLVAIVRPYGQSKTVQFQYRTDAPVGAWTDIGSAITSTGTLFTLAWDVTAIVASTYDLRVLIGGATSSGDNSCTVTIVGGGQQIAESVNGLSQFVKQEQIDITRECNVYLYDRTRILVPYGASQAVGVVSIQVTDIGINAYAVNGDATGLLSIDENRNFEILAGSTTLSSPVTLYIPYADANNDGYVDGTWIPEGSLQILWYDDTVPPGTWRRESPTFVNAAENWVSVDTAHLSTFGVFGPSSPPSADGGGGGGGGGGGCFVGTTCAPAPAAAAMSFAGIALAAMLAALVIVGMRR